MAHVWYINWQFLDIFYSFKVESSAKIEMQPRKLGYWKNLPPYSVFLQEFHNAVINYQIQNLRNERSPIMIFKFQQEFLKTTES